MKRGETLRIYLRKMPKKVWAILAAAVVLVTVCTVTTVIAVRHHRAKLIAAVPVETEAIAETVTESATETETETETVSESETESTTKAPPKVPVGTTKRKRMRKKPYRLHHHRSRLLQNTKSFWMSRISIKSTNIRQAVKVYPPLW